MTDLLNNAGWQVNHKRVERNWRREGLKIPQKQKSAPLMRHWLEQNDARAGFGGTPLETLLRNAMPGSG